MDLMTGFHCTYKHWRENLFELRNLPKNFTLKCDWLCENPPCSHANFDLFLGL